MIPIRHCIVYKYTQHLLELRLPSYVSIFPRLNGQKKPVKVELIMNIFHNVFEVFS